jgi:hypothetical protein
MRGEGGGEQEPGRGEGGGVPAAPGVAPLIVELEDRSSGDSAQQGDVSKSLKRVMAGGMAGESLSIFAAPVGMAVSLHQAAYAGVLASCSALLTQACWPRQL